MRDDKDRGSKWMIDHHGDGILWLGRVLGFASWRPAKSEVTVPRRLPDGLLEVFFPGRKDPDPFVIEIATYPDTAVDEQLLRDVALVWLDRQVLPEVLVLVLHPKGDLRVTGSKQLTSRHGLTKFGGSWHAIELWTQRAADLLAANDVGLVPWVPLTQFEGPTEAMIQHCRDRIDQQARLEERDNLLAVTQIMTRLRYNDQNLMSLLGGSRMFLESPLVQELMAQKEQETLHKAVTKVLEGRFGAVPPELISALRTVRDEQRLQDHLLQAALCPDLVSFRARLGL